MNRAVPIIAASLTAAVTSATAFTLFNLMLDAHALSLVAVAFWFAVVLVALAHFVFLGLPACLLLKRFGSLTWWSVTLTSFIIAIIPVAVFSTNIFGGASGAPIEIATILKTGLFGALGGAVGFVVWHRLKARRTQP